LSGGASGVVRAASPVGSLHSSLPGPGRVWKEGEGEGLGPLANGLMNSPKRKSGKSGGGCDQGLVGGIKVGVSTLQSSGL
jgi:hypothetical protein